MVDAARPGWESQNIFDGQSYTFTELNGDWKLIVAPKMCALVGPSDCVFRYRPFTPGGNGKAYATSRQGIGVFPAAGKWFVEFVESSGGALTRNYNLLDYAMYFGLADATAGVTGIDLTSIGGTPQSGVNVSSRFAPATWGANSGAIAYSAADAAAIPANANRRALSIYNESASATLALGVGTMTALRGVIVVPPSTNVIFNPLDGTTQQALRSWGSAAGNFSYVEGT